MKNRKLISSTESKVSIIQIFGFILIVTGVIAIILFGFLENSSLIAISFFIIMLGVAFAFPTLLEGNEGLSTMRIVVFMIVNVICLLLIKIGWGKDSLESIGLDQWWMGVIAFVFGAKAAQSYFESKLAVPKVKVPDSIGFSTPTLDIIEAFIIENKNELLSKYKADAVQASLKVINGYTKGTPSLQFIVKDKFNLPMGSEKIPPYFDYNGLRIITDVKEEDDPTEDVVGVCPGDSVQRQGTTACGTIGLKVYREVEGKRTDYLLSCFHVFCSSELLVGITEFNPSTNAPIIANIGTAQTVIGQVAAGDFNPKMDAALCIINDNTTANPALKGYPATPKNAIRILTNQDVEAQTKVFTYGAVTKSASGYVLAREIDRPIIMFGKSYTFRNIIPVTKISVPGDSGALVADEKGKVIGIIFASNDTTSFIIPIAEIIIHFNLKISHAS